MNGGEGEARGEQPVEAPPPKRRRGGRHRRRRKRWSLRRKILTVVGAVLLLAVAVAGGGWAYINYEWGKVKKVACKVCEVTSPTHRSGRTAIPAAQVDQPPYNVLLVGSDTRAGNTGQAALSFGTASQNPGQRSDTIKILHVDPNAGTATLLSIPRDTYVTMSGLPASSGLTGAQKINAAFNNGPVPLVETIQNTFGIPIAHFVVVDFIGMINAVNAVGGISLNFNYPVRDNDDGNDNSGLNITTTGCQVLNGNEALALARSRYYQYYDPSQGGWISDPTSDIGRIQRQDEIIEALISKAESTYNPLTLHSFISSAVNDIEVDQGTTLGDMYDLIEHYHAFSASKLQTYTLPTTSEVTDGGSDVEVVQEPEAQQTIATFLDGTPGPVSTPPLDQYGNPIAVPPASAGSGSSSSTSTPAAGAGGASSTTTAPPSTVTPTSLPSYDPTPC